MNVVIPMAGKSRRFKSEGYQAPKYLLPLENQLVIEAVMDCFDETDDFYLIVAADEIAESVASWLRSLKPRVTVVPIEPHDLGPVYSCLKAPITISGPTVISYCDFLIRWDYQKFVHFCQEFDAVVPTFSGFHPASFGDTKYAYGRVGEESRLLEIREKESFTDERWKEPASTGSYYFKTWSLFLEYARILLSTGSDLPNGEFYITGVVERMIEDGRSVGVSNVEKFICLGTPEDYHQYRYWRRAISQVADSSGDWKEAIDADLLITMAGKGERFSNRGYRIPKPLIPVEGKPLFVQAALSMPEMAGYYFAALASTATRYNLERIAAQSIPSSRVVTLAAETDGQLSTVAESIASIDGDRPLVVGSADYLLDLDSAGLSMVLASEDWDFVVITARSPRGIHDDYRSFAYCLAPDFPKIERIVEKSLISDEPWNDQVVTGTFVFRSKDVVRVLSERANQLNLTVNGEKYIGNALNLLIEMGFFGLAFESDLWVSLGTPFELELFEYWNDYFVPDMAG